MGKKRVYLSPKEVETDLNKAREKEGFTGEVEKAAVKTMIETAKKNGRVGDKLLIVLSPIYIHIPAWQRKLYLPRAQSIGTNYSKYKWEVPKVLYIDDKLIVIDGMHRIYGSYIGGLDGVTVEIITDMTEQEAIEIFLDQGIDRRNMSPSDVFEAAIHAEKKEYVALKAICAKNHVRVKGDDKTVVNPVGILTSISDGVGMAKSNPELLDQILTFIEKLQWNGGNIYEGKAYSAKILRVFKKLYAYYAGKETAMENILLNDCKGAKYFNNNVADKCQDILFDYLSAIIEEKINIPTVETKRRSKKLVRVN